jgi:hypothetical protein
MICFATRLDDHLIFSQEAEYQSRVEACFDGHVTFVFVVNAICFATSLDGHVTG